MMHEKQKKSTIVHAMEKKKEKRKSLRKLQQMAVGRKYYRAKSNDRLSEKTSNTLKKE